MRQLRLTVPLVLALALSACSDTPVPVAEDAVVIDVRTPAEYAEGHLDGAVNLDVQDAGFTAEVAALDAEVPYVVYCRSGNRSAAAAAAMAQAGLDVIDAGALADAARTTGLDVVTD